MGGLLAWEFLLFHWVEVRRWQDIKKKDSVNQVSLNANSNSGSQSSGKLATAGKKAALLIVLKPVQPMSACCTLSQEFADLRATAVSGSHCFCAAYPAAVLCSAAM